MPPPASPSAVSCANLPRSASISSRIFPWFLRRLKTWPISLNIAGLLGLRIGDGWLDRRGAGSEPLVHVDDLRSEHVHGSVHQRLLQDLGALALGRRGSGVRFRSRLARGR